MRAALESSRQIELLLYAPDLLPDGHGQATVDLARAMGATFHFSLISCEEASFIDWASDQRLPVIGASDHAEVEHATHLFARAFVLLMGNEWQGPPTWLEEIGTTMVCIPMAGPVDSLNLAVATDLVLYEAGTPVPATWGAKLDGSLARPDA